MASTPRARPVALIVLDGWGYRPETEGNAIALANTPTWDGLWSRGSRTLLEASGLRVGLPEGQMGNSEVGHLNLGAGRVVTQDLVRISSAISDGSFYTNPALVGACRQVKGKGGTLHLMGLIGAGGVHAIDTHLFAMLDLAKRDRREVTPYRRALPAGAGADDAACRGGERDQGRAAARLPHVGQGPLRAEDRRRDRTELAYRAMVLGEGPQETDPLEAIRKAYETEKTDEFMLPVVIAENGKPVARMMDGDAVIGFNYRSDRMRQIVRALIDPAFDGFDTKAGPKVTVTTLTNYDKTFPVPIAFEPTSMVRILAEVLSSHGLDMLKTAETEKYPHVTYFFNGGVEAPFPCEHRVLVPSPKVATYDLKPEMSAEGVTDALVKGISSGEHDFTLCNYANADMVGHSGSIPATIKAVESVDRSLSRVLKAAEAAGTRLIVTADHGNAEMLIDPETGGPHTAHTTNPVPFVVIDWEQEQRLRPGGALCDVAPTILSMLGLPQPAEMTGVNLGVD